MTKFNKRVNRQLITMQIDKELYMKSKNIIPNRTQDYEDYLRRRLSSKNRLEMLRKEREQLIDRVQELDLEIENEILFRRDLDLVEMEYEEVMDKAMKILNRMFKNHGKIGLNNIENVAVMNDLDYSDLKSRLPAEIKAKIVPHLEAGIGVEYPKAPI